MPHWRERPQSMVVNVKLVALDNLQAASIQQSSEPNENKRGENACNPEACVRGYSSSNLAPGARHAAHGDSLTLLLRIRVHIIVQMFLIPLLFSALAPKNRSDCRFELLYPIFPRTLNICIIIANNDFCLMEKKFQLYHGFVE